MLETIIRSLGGLQAFSTLWVLLYGIWQGSQREAGRSSGVSITWLRSAVFYLTATALFVGGAWLGWKPLQLLVSPQTRSMMLAVGSFLYFPGMGLVLWGRLALGRNYFVSTGIGAQLFADQQLVTTGPYAVMRHPMYAGLMLAALGGLLIYFTWTTAFFVISAPFLTLRMHREEQVLAAEFGPQWQEYSRQVPALFPRLPKFLNLAQDERPGLSIEDEGLSIEMCIHLAAAQASPNIAFIKYWGDRDSALHIPAGPSLSMNLSGLNTRTRVDFDPALTADELIINGQRLNGPPQRRVTAMLDRVRKLSSLECFALVESANNFPAGAGIASSASAFAALALAASSAAGLKLSEPDLSRLARTGSGSASRSIPGGFVEWQAGTDDASSYAFSIAPPEHWDLVDLVAIVSTGHKPVGSTEGHTLAPTSPLQPARLQGTAVRLEQCRTALLQRDFEALAQVMEFDSNLMHAVMLTSSPPLLYWLPPTVEIMHAVVEMRKNGLPAAFTIDAGPNVHVLTLSAYAGQVLQQLQQIPGVAEVLSAAPGGPARLVDFADVLPSEPPEA